jgi:hypothetical protein
MATKRRREETTDQQNVKRIKPICEKAEKIKNEYPGRNSTDYDAWRNALIAAYQECKQFTCNQQDKELVDLLAEISINDMEGGSKMVGGNPIVHLSKLNSWLLDNGNNVSNCAKWLLTKIWYLLKTGVTIVDDIGRAALGHSDTQTFKLAVSVAGYLKDTVAQGAAPHYDVFEQYLKTVMNENKEEIRKYLPGSVTPDTFEAWLQTTPTSTKLYWTLVTMKLAQTSGLIVGTATVVASIAVQLSTYGLSLTYYFTNNYIFTGALLLHAGFNSLPDESKDKLINYFNKLDEYIAGKIGPSERQMDLDSMMDHLYNTLTEPEKQFALEVASLDREQIQANIENAEVNRDVEHMETKLVKQENIINTKNATNALKAKRNQLKEKFNALKGTTESLNSEQVEEKTEETEEIEGGKRKTRRKMSKKIKQGKKGKKGGKSRRKH